LNKRHSTSEHKPQQKLALMWSLSRARGKR
jgi:hypothetical protein